MSQLQRAIERDLSIPMERQVMLVSGGEAMSPASRVSSYSAGTVSLFPLSYLYLFAYLYAHLSSYLILHDGRDKVMRMVSLCCHSHVSITSTSITEKQNQVRGI